MTKIVEAARSIAAGSSKVARAGARGASGSDLPCDRRAATECLSPSPSACAVSLPVRSASESIVATASAIGAVDLLRSQRLCARNAIDPLHPIAARQIARLLGADPLAARAMAQLHSHGTEVVLEFGLGPSRLMGKADVLTNRVTIFVRNHDSPDAVVATIVHESSHIHRYFRGSRRTQLDEVRARARAFLYTEGRRPDRSERRAIWREVEELGDYADLSRSHP